MFALEPTLIAFTHYLFAETRFLFFFVSAVLLLVANAERPRWWGLVATGVLFGLASSTRSIGFYFLVLMTPWRGWRAGVRSSLRTVGALWLGAAIVVAPWAAYHRVVLVDATVGINLWRGNNVFAPSDMDYGMRRLVGWRAGHRLPAERADAAGPLVSRSPATHIAVMSERNVTRVVTAHRQTEGGGFVVRRPFPTRGLDGIDPFLLLDEMGPADYGPGEAVGAPDHPHRGFETVTYMLEGEFEHEDSAGRRGRLQPGDVQWMTAGAGVIHSEMPSARIRQEGGRVHGFQIWVNLPARDKLMTPRYQEVPAARIPTAQTPDGKARVRVIAGEALSVHAVIDTRTPILYQHWSLAPDGAVEAAVPASYGAFVYVFGGAAEVGGRRLVDGQLGELGAGDRVRLASAEGAELLLLGGEPLREPVARYGPFVMNSEREIVEAIHDFRAGRMGRIDRE